MRRATSKAIMVSIPSKRWESWTALIIGSAFIAAAVTTTAQAQSTGIAACDDFLTKYDTCVTSKLPAAQQATYKTQLDQTRKMWLDMAKNPAVKSNMEATCKQTTDAMKAALQQYGCTF
jgi:hypothetical protein